MSVSNMGRKYSVQGNLLIIKKIYRTTRYGGTGNYDPRGEIAEFSRSSGGRMRKYLRTCRAEYRSMVTLTYPEGLGLDGERCKEDLRRFIQELRRENMRNHNNKGGRENHVEPEKWGCFWFMEFQARGAIHFHMFCTDYYSYRWIARRWYEIVGSEDKRHEQAGSRIEKIRSGSAGIIKYASKYAVKMEQKTVPEGFGWIGRFWGIYGLRGTVSADTIINEADIKDPGLARVRERLNDLVFEGIQAGKVTALPQNIPNTAVFVIKSASLVARIRREVDQMAIYSTYYSEEASDYWNYAGIDGDD